MGRVIQAEALAWRQDELRETAWYIQWTGSISVSVKEGGNQQEKQQTGHRKPTMLS